MNFQHWVIATDDDLNTFDVGFYGVKGYVEKNYKECKAPSVSELSYYTTEVIYGRVWI